MTTIITPLLLLLLLPGCVADATETLDDFEEFPSLDDDDQESAVQALAPIDAEEGELRFDNELDPEQEWLDPEFTTEGSATNWFCYGENTHTVVGNQVIWKFYTRNDSSRAKRDPSVHGTVFHPDGSVLTCYSNKYNSENTCTIVTTLESNYNSSIGQHRCCERRSTSYPCTSTFYTSDAL